MVFSFSKSLLVGALVFSVATLSAQTLAVSPATSTVDWTGHKAVGSSHNGKVTLKSGELEFVDGVLKGGSFVADMTTISVEDLEGEMAGKLAGHLFSDDFFSTATYPTATFLIKGVEKTGDNTYLVAGDMTIKGHTEPVTFPVTVSEKGGKQVAQATIKLDRTKYGVRYGSDSFFDNLGDKVISDEFDLTVMLMTE